MAVVIARTSEEAKEKNKWESVNSIYTDPEQGDVRPGRPYGSMCELSVRQADGSVKTTVVKVGDVWPRMMYRARRRQDGYLCVIDPRNDDDSQSWSRQNYMVCKTENEHPRMLEQGWRDTQQEALELFNSKEKAISTAAAHRAYEDQNMSEPAKREAEKVEAASAGHVAEIPAQPRQKRKYVRKVKPEAN